MNEERWKSFTAFAARVFGKPTFDLEEREPRLRVALQLAEALARVTADDGSTVEVARVLSSYDLRTGELTPSTHRTWFLEWLASGDAELSRVLASFTDPRRGELERFDAYARAYERAVGEGRIAANPAAAIGIGSLLNFAVDSQRLPIVLERPQRIFWESFGVEPVPNEAPAERYREHLERARSAERRLRSAGVPVRDMIDVQSLMRLAVQTPGFWTDQEGLEGSAPPREREPDVYLSVCAMYRDEAPYLREWIEFHRLVGVERFFLYNNLSVDDHMSVLEPYIERGTVCVEDWPMTEGAQIPAYDHCIREHGAESRWLAIIDIDEFLFSPTGTRLPDLLPEYEQWPAVGANWAVFGPSGHQGKPPGLVIENYRWRLRTDASQMATKTIKSVLDPARVVRTMGVHSQGYDRLGTVDENHYPIHGGRTKSVSFARLRVNHYFTKSIEEFQRLGTRVGQNPAKGKRNFDIPLDRVWDDETVCDETIIQYLPALREALSETAPR